MVKRTWKEKINYTPLAPPDLQELGIKFRNRAFLAISGLIFIAWTSYESVNGSGDIGFIYLHPIVLIFVLISIISTPIAFYLGVRFAIKTNMSIYRTMTILALITMISLILLIFNPKY